MKVNLRTEMKGLFSLTVHNEKGEVVSRTGWFENLILDQGITALLSTGTPYCFYRFLKVGTGTSAPSPSDTSIDQVASLESTTGNRYWIGGYDAEGGYHWARGSVQFGQGVAAGNLSEVAAGWSNSANDIFSRALILDGAGNPTTITVLPNEFLTVEYELRSWHVVPEPHELTYDDDGVPAVTTVTYTQPATNVKAPTGRDSFHSPFNFVSDYSPSFAGLSPDGNAVTYTLSYSLNQGNPQISSIPLNANAPDTTLIPYGGNQRTFCTFDPPIPKTNEFTAAIDIEISFGRR